MVFIKKEYFVHTKKIYVMLMKLVDSILLSELNIKKKKYNNNMKLKTSRISVARIYLKGFDEFVVIGN